MPLNRKQQRFVAEYLVDFNATQAAIRCGYSPKTAKQQGSRLLTHVDVQAAVARGSQRQLEKAEQRAALTVESLAEEYRNIGLSDLGDMIDEHGKLKPIHQLPRSVRAAIASVKVTKKNLAVGDGVMDDVVEIKLWDKLRALQDAAKHLGWLVEKIEVKVDDPVTARMHAARARVDKLKKGHGSSR